MAVIWDPTDDPQPFPFDSVTVCLDYRSADNTCWTIWDRLKVDQSTTLFKLIERLTVILQQSARDPSIWEVNPTDIHIRLMPNRPNPGATK